MVLSGTLRVLLGLLCLCLRGTEALDVDQNALARIIEYIQTKYSPTEDGQYAVAIYVPVGYCSKGSNPEDGEFLKHDKPYAAKTAMKGTERVYEGQELIGATRKDADGISDFHSEYLLLKHPNEVHSPMMNLLNKHEPKDRCVIFYTYNSPCMGTCLKEGNKERNILETIEKVLSKFEGPKAFVYNRIFHYNIGKPDLGKYLKEVDNKIPLYRCYSAPPPPPERKRVRSREGKPSDRSRQATSSDRSRQATSRDRSRQATFRKRSRRATSPDRFRKPIPYECHRCFSSGEVADQCVSKKV